MISEYPYLDPSSGYQPHQHVCKSHKHKKYSIAYSCDLTFKGYCQDCISKYVTLDGEKLTFKYNYWNITGKNMSERIAYNNKINFNMLKRIIAKCNKEIKRVGAEIQQVSNYHI